MKNPYVKMLMKLTPRGPNAVCCGHKVEANELNYQRPILCIMVGGFSLSLHKPLHIIITYSMFLWYFTLSIFDFRHWLHEEGIVNQVILFSLE